MKSEDHISSWEVEHSKNQSTENNGDFAAVQRGDPRKIK